MIGFDDMPLFFTGVKTGKTVEARAKEAPSKPAKKSKSNKPIVLLEASAPEPEPGPLIEIFANEFVMMGEISDANNIQKMLTVQVRSRSLKPGELTTNLPKPQTRRILLTASTIIARRDKGSTPLKFEESRRNDTIKIVGEMSPDTPILKARIIWVYE